MSDDLEELRSLVRLLHVHFDVEPELEIRDGVRVKLGAVVRLWGVHAKGARALPGCAKCHEIVSRLRAVLDYALDHDSSMHVAVEPFRRALYDSRVVPDADEVALAVRMSSARPDGATAVLGAKAREASDAEDRCLKAIRARLRALGVPER